MKFGVFIRSIGERTEQLCFEAVHRFICAEDIHLIKNHFPSTKAYFKMFEIAEIKGYDWYLGIDADVILTENWYNLFVSQLSVHDTKNVFRMHFLVKDSLMSTLVGRGNNWYNGNYTNLSRKHLLKNERIRKYWFYYKYRGYSSGSFTKPESSIASLMLKESGLHKISNKEMIGWHSYEQYYHELFRQYFTRYHRESNSYISKNELYFLQSENLDSLIMNKKWDMVAANLGWNEARNHTLKNVDAQQTRSIASVRLKETGLIEKQTLEMPLDMFYKKMKQGCYDKH